MTNEELKERIEDILESFDEDDLINAWNTFCKAYAYEEIIELNNPDELFMGDTPSDILRNIDKEYSINDTYAYSHVGTWYSFDSTIENICPIEISDLADYIIRECDDLGNSDIEDIFIEYDNDNMEGDEYTD